MTKELLFIEPFLSSLITSHTYCHLLHELCWLLNLSIPFMLYLTSKHLSCHQVLLRLPISSLSITLSCYKWLQHQHYSSFEQTSTILSFSLTIPQHLVSAFLLPIALPKLLWSLSLSIRSLSWFPPSFITLIVLQLNLASFPQSITQLYSLLNQPSSSTLSSLLQFLAQLPSPPSISPALSFQFTWVCSPQAID